MIFWDTLKRLFLLNPFPTLFNSNPIFKGSCSKYQFLISYRFRGYATRLRTQKSSMNVIFGD